MHFAELEPAAPDRIDLGGKRLLIFIVAYNAETTIEKVLSRIPPSLQSGDVEILIIDDFSKDDTFVNGLRYQQRDSAFKITVLRTPENQGYGGNQKLGLPLRDRQRFRHRRARARGRPIRAGKIADVARAPGARARPMQFSGRA